MSDVMKLKTYKLLAEIRGKFLSRIISDARNKTEYFKDNVEELSKFTEFIANPKKWDYCGMLSKEDIKVLETLEYLLDDEQDEIYPYPEWKPYKKD